MPRVTAIKVACQRGAEAFYCNDRGAVFLCKASFPPSLKPLLSLTALLYVLAYHGCPSEKKDFYFFFTVIRDRVRIQSKIFPKS